MEAIEYIGKKSIQIPYGKEKVKSPFQTTLIRSKNK